MPEYAGWDRNENEGECIASKRSLCVYMCMCMEHGEGEKYNKLLFNDSRQIVQ